MRIGKVIGTVTLNRCHPSLTGGRFKLVVPLSLADLAGLATGSGVFFSQTAGQTENLSAEKDSRPLPAREEITVYDELGAGIGSLIAISEGAEASRPFYPNEKVIDAYNAAILDTVRVQIAEVGRDQERKMKDK